jgi:hypothetical protein
VRLPPLGAAWWLLVVGAIVALLTMLVDVRAGGYLLAATTGMGALMRAAMPERFTGAVAVRRRGTDVVLYGLVTLALIVVFTLVKL